MRPSPGKLIEFGHMVEIEQVDGRFITRYDVFEKRPNENEIVDPALEYHRDLFGYYPERVTADKGFYENMDAIKKLEAKVPTVAIAKKGSRTAEEWSREHAPAFRRAQRFRAGIEGTISFLKRALGLFRCRNKGWKHFCSTVGAAIFAHNLLNLARS